LGELELREDAIRALGDAGRVGKGSQRPMENSLLVGLSRQVALARELDIVSNNIANMNTTGYKADTAVFQEYLMPRARENRFQTGDREVRFVQDRATRHDFSQGPIQQTGNPLDVAIDGDAFLVVQTSRGERYTRNGALQINAAGQLVTPDGSPVLGENGPIVFQPLDRNVAISADGRVSVNEGAGSRTESLRGKIRLVGFAQRGRLEKEGTNTLAAPAGVAPQPAPASKLVQGAIEKSNVNGVVEMTRMIEVTRTYTNVANILQQQSDLRRSAIEKLSEVPS
jgi:flagellar basal-body rod protein FlgF/flagellar basal-body rod protein FlgG